MKKVNKKWLVAGTVVVVGGAVGAGAVIANQADDTDVPITGPALEQATIAALAHTGEGHVTGTEVGDEDSYYEVEVTLNDGSQVDVQLDRNFNVVSDKVDDDEGADDGTDDD
jgi:hypothetical protein